MIYSVKPHIRIAARLGNTDERIVLINNNNNTEYYINDLLYNILNIINKGCYTEDDIINKIAIDCNISSDDCKETIEFLINENIIFKSIEKQRCDNILPLYKGAFPLNSISLEVTSSCNLKCKHCYGDYEPSKNDNISVDFIEQLLPDLDYLNTYNVGLTGGEYFIHPHYDRLFSLFEKKGYAITIFSNGLASNRIKQLVMKHQGIRFICKISLDGFKNAHNELRGNENSYEKACESINYLKSCSNVELKISCGLGKHNAKEMEAFLEFMRCEYNVNPQVDLIYPLGPYNQKSDYAYLPEEFDQLNELYPMYFKGIVKRDIVENKKSFRCVGGINTVTINPEMIVKICNNASDKRFHFGSLTNNSLIDLWENPPSNIQPFRKEKFCDIEVCKNCEYYLTCRSANCRTLAYCYTGDHLQPNPIICYAQRLRSHENIDK